MCEHCGQVHLDDVGFDEGDLNEHDFYKYDFEVDTSEAVEFLRVLASTPIQSMITPELGDALLRLRESGYLREEAIVTVLEAMVDEIQKAAESGEAEPNLSRYTAALARLPDRFDPAAVVENTLAFDGHDDIRF